jgi:hypothetical protein
MMPKSTRIATGPADDYDPKIVLKSSPVATGPLQIRETIQGSGLVEVDVPANGEQHWIDRVRQWLRSLRL